MDDNTLVSFLQDNRGEIIKIGEGVKAIHNRMDGFQETITKIEHTVHGNSNPGLKTRVAVTESRVKLIGGLLGAIGLAIILTYFGLK
ncbi:MAG: hypothetical protein ACUZ8I_14985 [Candidatus Scalindua sp.]